MWKPLSATWVICSALVGAVTAPLLPDAEWPEESSGNSCLSKPQGTSHTGYFPRSTHEACVRSAMLLGSETWGPMELELRRLRRNDRAMILLTCGIKDRDEAPSASLLLKLGIEGITSVLRCRRLRWYGHVQRATSCIKYITNCIKYITNLTL